MDAVTDTDAVKQSLSVAAATFGGMGLIGITAVLGFLLLSYEINNYLVMVIILLIYMLLDSILMYILDRKSDKLFNNIN